MMTSDQVVEMSVNVTSNSPSQDYTHPDDHNLPNYDMTPGFKPFTIIKNNIIIIIRTFPECFAPEISMQNNLVNLWSKRMLYNALFTIS